MRKVTFAVTQFECKPDRAANFDMAEHLVRHAAAESAQVVLLQALFADLYSPLISLDGAGRQMAPPLDLT